MKKSMTIVEITIAVGIVALLVAIAIPKLLRARQTANAVVTKASLRSLAVAAETFANDHSGTYPADITELKSVIRSAPDYCGKVVRGYAYACDLALSGYAITATPVTLNVTGATIYTATTGGVFTSS